MRSNFQREEAAMEEEAGVWFQRATIRDGIRFGIVGVAIRGVEYCLEDEYLEMEQNPNLVVELGFICFGVSEF
nr:hypothetical protein TEA_009541 [Ipomoea batatas]